MSKHCVWFELGLRILNLERKVGDTMWNVSVTTKEKVDITLVGYKVGQRGL